MPDCHAHPVVCSLPADALDDRFCLQSTSCMPFAGLTAMNVSLPNCWDASFKCSCGDCPEAPFCAPVSLAAVLRV